MSLGYQQKKDRQKSILALSGALESQIAGDRRGKVTQKVCLLGLAMQGCIDACPPIRGAFPTRDYITRRLNSPSNPKPSCHETYSNFLKNSLRVPNSFSEESIAG